MDFEDGNFGLTFARVTWGTISGLAIFGGQLSGGTIIQGAIDLFP